MSTFAHKSGVIALSCAIGLAGCGTGENAPDDTTTAVIATEATETRVADGSAEARPVGFRLERIVDGIGDALFVTFAPGEPGRLYIVTQSGTIQIYEGGRLRSEPFLDISRQISRGGERGLLGLAFDPHYEDNRRFFVNYTDSEGSTRVVRYTAGPGSANPDSATLIMRIPQPYANHNGGMLAFGPDGMLYIALGDGGSGGDPENRAQDLGDLMGTILRVDVSGDRYTVPHDNPFRDTEGARNEIWHYGLRNPWRFSFDRSTGDMWIADVGQNRIEEINRAPEGKGGLNFGWNAFEGRESFGGSLRPGTTATPPVTQYSHAVGQSVTGGYVYRGDRVPDLQGRYVFSDYVSGRVWSLRAGDKPGGLRDETDRLGTSLERVTSFGEGANGDLYVIANQTLYRFDTP